MEFRAIAEKLGLCPYPEELDRIYAEMSDADVPACDIALIDSLQEKYDLFEEFYDLVRQTAQEINSDKALNAWVRVSAQFHKESNMAEAFQLPMPILNGSPVKDLMMLHIMMPMIPDSFAKMEKRGFSWEEMADARNAYKGGMRIVQRQIGRPAINKTYFHWLNLYCRALIFRVAGFWFEVRQFPLQALWLRNRETKQIVPLMKGTFCRDGSMVLGSKNNEDPEDAFTTEFSEDAENFYGHGCIDNVVSHESTAYPKKSWECTARPGEYCLGMHIPRNADVSKDATMHACKAALQMVHERFPEYGVSNGVFCASWLLNPRLRQIQGDQSRITQFGECFTRFPMKDAVGSAVFSFVFIRKPEKLQDLPEDTSLQRKLKKLYLNGDCIHTYSGAIFMED